MQIKTNITNEALQGRLSMRNRYIVAIIVMVPLIILSQAKGAESSNRGPRKCMDFRQKHVSRQGT